MAQTFRCSRTIRFGQCDPAGLVFYPRYADMAHEVIEDWFRDALGVPLPVLHGTQRRGFPTRRLHVDFLAPSRHGDVLDFALTLRHLGHSAVQVWLDARCAGQPRVRIDQWLAHVALDTLQPEPMDAALRARMQAFVHFDPSEVSP